MPKNMLTRREALHRAVFVIGGATAAAQLAACGYSVEETEAASGEPGRFFTAREMTTLADVAEAMIPQTDTPGARAANVHGFIDAMMLNWASADSQAQFRRALARFDVEAKAMRRATFSGLDAGERAALVAWIDAAAFGDDADEADADYRRLKWLVFHGYYTSEAANPDYIAVPGSFHGCVSAEERDALMSERTGRPPRQGGAL